MMNTRLRSAPADTAIIGWRVLLVDDDIDCGDMLRTELERRGLDVTLHAGAMVALAEFRQNPELWNVVITDNLMPGMRGIDLVRAVRTMRPKMPCVICTGYASDINAATLGDMASTTLLPKPIDMEHLIDTLVRIAAFGKTPLSGDSRLTYSGKPEWKSERQLAEHAPVGLFSMDHRGKCTYANPATFQLLGMPSMEKRPRHWVSFIHPEDRIPVFSEWLAAFGDATSFRREFRVLGRGHEKWVQCHAVPMFTSEGRLAGYSCALSDASERHNAQARMDFLAHHDPLTGLPNRVLARDRLRQTISFAGRGRFQVALLLVDVDHFKMLNDSLGHSIGDAALVATAERLKRCVREVDTVSRLGGDEFLLILTDARGPDTVATVALKLVESLKAPLEIDGHELAITISVGISVYPDDGSEFDVLLGKADTALYQAKASGRNAYRFFAERMNIDTIRQFEFRTQLRHALTRGEFELHYQPIMRASDGTLAGAEALIRWKHPDRGLIYPDAFIPIAEESGLIVPIGEWALKEACRQVVEWDRIGLGRTFVAVNLSAVQFRQIALLEAAVEAALAESGLSPDRLELELTESMLIETPTIVLDTIERLSKCGIRFSIDDFGTGYSSLAYLRHFKVHKLKIDKSFIHDLGVDHKIHSIVRAIIQLAKGLNLEVVAEGVELASDLDFLKSNSCDLIQGYLFSKPLPAEKWMKFWRTNWGNMG